MTLLVTCSVLLAAGAGAWAVSAGLLAATLWAVVTAFGLVFALTNAVGAIRRREFTVDLIAILALLGAALVREWLAGAMIALMLSTGALLEAKASARAVRDLGLLVQRAPRTARRHRKGAVAVCSVEDVAIGDELLVGPGEVVPVDGRLTSAAVLDESALTGESLPVDRCAGQSVRSGVVNGGGPLEMVATTTAAESTYTALVRLVEEAKSSSAPFVRVADRFALVFVPVTLLLAAAAWAAGGSVRAVAVLVVATPCPLLLAAPIAFLSGISQAARRGVVVKGAGALEKLADGEVMIFDKTGTLTLGRPVLRDVLVSPGRWDTPTVLRLAASLDQVSAHVLADPITKAAHQRGLTLRMPTAVEEVRGYGIKGEVDGHRMQVGKASWIVGAATPDWVARAQRRAALEESLIVFVGVDGEPAAALLFADRVRRDAPRMIRALRGAGISRVVLLTGDRSSTAARVGREVGVDEVLAECDPAAKLAAVERESAGRATVMVGDGINDAPALAQADLGIAIGTGADVALEASDITILGDDLGSVPDGIGLSRATMRIVRQNLGWAFGYNVLLIPVAAGVLYPLVGLTLSPALAAAAMALSSVSVVGNSLRLRAFQPAS